MDKKILILGVVIAVFVLAIAYNIYTIRTISQTVVQKNIPKTEKKITSQPAVPETQPVSEPAPGPFVAPLTRAGERVTKKPFGIFITPQNSPVQPEKFRGWHTGADFEIFPEELDTDVPVVAVCDGKLLAERTASGYGGVAVESYELDSQPITIIYGHLKLASIAKKAGDSISQGEEIGILGKAYSVETDGERKHLHLGVHKGNGIDIRGYVQNQSELSQWVDPCSLGSICQ